MKYARYAGLAAILGVTCAAVTCVKSQDGGPVPEGIGGGASQTTVTASASTSGSSSSGSGGDASGCAGPYCADPSNCGAPGHSCFGGSCSAGSCQATTLADAIQDPWHIALDASTVYVAGHLDAQEGQPCSDLPRVDSWSISAGTETPVLVCAAAPGLGDNVRNFVIYEDQIYWSTGQDPNDVAAGELYHANVSMAVPASLGVTNQANQLAIDATGVYYSNVTGAYRIHLDGTGNAQITGEFAKMIAIDDTNVYLGEAPCDGDQCDENPSIYSVPKTGGTKSTLVASTPDIAYMQVFGGYLYWADNTEPSGVIYRVPTTGGPTETVLVGAGVDIIGIVVDAASLYTLEWTADRVCNVNRYGLDGTHRTNLASQQRYSCAGIGANDDAIVWAAAPYGSAKQNLYLLAK